MHPKQSTNHGHQPSRASVVWTMIIIHSPAIHSPPPYTATLLPSPLQCKQRYLLLLACGVGGCCHNSTLVVGVGGCCCCCYCCYCHHGVVTISSTMWSPLPPLTRCHCWWLLLSLSLCCCCCCCCCCCIVLFQITLFYFSHLASELFTINPERLVPSLTASLPRQTTPDEEPSPSPLQAPLGIWLFLASSWKTKELPQGQHESKQQSLGSSVLFRWWQHPQLSGQRHSWLSIVSSNWNHEQTDEQKKINCAFGY